MREGRVNHVRSWVCTSAWLIRDVASPPPPMLAGAPELRLEGGEGLATGVVGAGGGAAGPVADQPGAERLAVDFRAKRRTRLLGCFLGVDVLPYRHFIAGAW